MEQLDKAINWTRIDEILIAHYTVGTSNEGADAYPPLLLTKCLLLQKCFHIDSDPELENQINDRLSFKKFLHLPLNMPSPDHSTFSRFRGRLSKNAMDQVNTEILRQFESQGLTINEGIAVDARRVKSASRPISNDKIKKVYADKGYLPSGISLCEPAEGGIPPGGGKPNRDFLALNKIADGIMRKDSTTAKLTR